jgi:Ca2+-binding EF-hand superfamily protein
MRVTSSFLKRMHLDRRHSLLSARNLLVLREYFQVLDARKQESLDDIQFLSFITLNTDLSESKAYGLFDIFDIDGSGSVDFDEFYLLCAMLIAVKDGEEKRFLRKLRSEQ